MHGGAGGWTAGHSEGCLRNRRHSGILRHLPQLGANEQSDSSHSYDSSSSGSDDDGKTTKKKIFTVKFLKRIFQRLPIVGATTELLHLKMSGNEVL